MTAYEMRKVLQHAQRFFLSVPATEAFGRPTHTLEGKPNTVSLRSERAGLL